MKQNEQGIFINGKQQIIEMLQFMNEEEKNKLLKNIRIKNAAMAKELSEQSFSFKDLFRLPSNSLKKIFEKSNPAIIGLALYPLPQNLQRKALVCIERSIAEGAFQVMSQDLSSKKTECRRAQDKIVQTAINLSRLNTISL